MLLALVGFQWRVVSSRLPSRVVCPERPVRCLFCAEHLGIGGMEEGVSEDKKESEKKKRAIEREAYIKRLEERKEKRIPGRTNG
jgi:hypothetical protein